MDPENVLTAVEGDLLNIFTQGNVTRTIEEIVADVFSGQTASIEGVFLHSIGDALDAAGGGTGAREAARAATKNIDNLLESGAGTLDQRLAVANGCGVNVLAAAITFGTLYRQYILLQGAVVAAKQLTDPKARAAALAAARAARDAASGNLKTAMGDIIRASAGAQVEATPPAAPAPAAPSDTAGNPGASTGA